MFGLVSDCTCGIVGSRLTAELEHLLMDPAIAGFVEAALAVSDAHDRGLVADLGSFEAWCERISENIAGRPILDKQTFVYTRPLPPVMKMAFDAVLSGAAVRLQSTVSIQ
jgi:hypothetical protein